MSQVTREHRLAVALAENGETYERDLTIDYARYIEHHADDEHPWRNRLDRLAQLLATTSEQTERRGRERASRMAERKTNANQRL